MGSVRVEPRPHRRFFNYPEPLKGPDVVYRNDTKSNPAIRGVFIHPAAFLMEWFKIVREYVWQNTGFSKLRLIRKAIEDYEPWYLPEIVPLGETNRVVDSKVIIEEQLLLATSSNSTDGNQANYPEAKYYSVADYRKLYLAGELTPTDVAKAILPLIRRDTTPPGQHSTAWFDTKVDLVLRAAAASTKRYQENRSLGPLDGVPTAVKDEYDMDGYTTCLGSRNDYTGPILENGSNRAWCVRKLEEAGAVILGKTSMHEFGLDTPGNNPVYGTPRNPYNENYYTGGSSSGTAYAVSAGLIPIGLGSDGGGSIRIPASFCGVFGLKPTHGRISCKPSQNHSSTCAVLGPIAADIESLATVFQVIAAPHPTSPFPPMPPIRLVADPSNASNKKKILGIPEAWFARATPGIQKLCRALIARLVSQCGYETIPIDIPYLMEGQLAHAMTVLNDASTLLPDTGNLTPANRIMLALGRTTPANDFLLAQKLRRVLMQHLAWLWEQYPGMLIVTPVASCAGWPIRGGEAELRHGVSDGDTTIATMEYAWMANFCGLPSIAVPAGFVAPEGAAGEGAVAGADVPGRVPVGLMAMGDWCAEEQLLQFGLEAQGVGAGVRGRPPVWVDVVEEARKVV